MSSVAHAPAIDPARDQIIEDGRVVQQFDRLAWQKKEMERIDAIDSAAQKAGALIRTPNGMIVYRVGGDVKAPVKISGDDPQYPKELAAKKIGGLIILEAIIDEQGRVTDIHTLLSPNSDLTDAAIKALKSWRFRPGTSNGQPVPVIYNLTVKMTPE